MFTQQNICSVTNCVHQIMFPICLLILSVVCFGTHTYSHECIARSCMHRQFSGIFLAMKYVAYELTSIFMHSQLTFLKYNLFDNIRHS